MKRVLLSLLAIVLIVGVFGAAGFAGYQYGFRQGALSTSNGNTRVNPFSGNNGPRGLQRHNFGFGFGSGRAFGPRGFGMMMRPGGIMGFGFLGPLMFLLRIAFWLLVIWAIYMLITRSGWRLTRQTTGTAPASIPPASVAPAAPVEPDNNEPPVGN